ncbi:MAG: hypothetical protein ACE5IJ_03310 [Thermoplasmata archaeon]
MFTAEQYKVAIRDYMEADGYAQTTDSFYEGDLPDMVFVPLRDHTTLQEVWVEAKARPVSLSDPDFRKEMASYLERWLRLRREARFQMRVFLTKMRAPSRWEDLFGRGMSEAAVSEWLTLEDENSEHDSDNDLPGRDVEDVLSFFTEAQVIEGTADDLRRVAEEKRRVGLSAMEIRRHAQELWREMRKRARPVPRRSKLLSNLLEFIPPPTYVALRVDDLSLPEMFKRLDSVQHPPFQVLSRGRILSLRVDGVGQVFSPLGVSDEEIIDLNTLEEQNPRRLVALFNRAIDKVLASFGARRHGYRYYFIASREAKAGMRREIPTPSGRRLTVARPMTREEPEGTAGPPEDGAALVSWAPRSQRLHWRPLVGEDSPGGERAGTLLGAPGCD